MPSWFHSPRLWLAVLFLFHLCVNTWWLWEDNHAVRTDEETHMIAARDYYTALFPTVGDRSLHARFTALARIRTDVGNPVHPPLLHIAGALLVRCIGYSVDRLAFVNTIAFLFAMLGVYLLARKLLTPQESFFATLVFSFTPLVYAASRYFMTDFLSMALVIWVTYALLRSEGFTRTGWCVVCGFLSGLALLARSTAPVYYFVPGLLTAAIGAFKVFRDGGSWKFLPYRAGHILINGLVIVALTFIVCLPWYLLHGEQFLRYWMTPEGGAKTAPVTLIDYMPAQVPDKSGDLLMDETIPERPSVEPASPEVRELPQKQWRFALRPRIPWMRYPVFTINNAVFLPMFFLSLAGMVVCLLSRRFRRQVVPWFLISWLIGAYVLLTLLLSWATPRYTLQALPALAVLSTLPLFLLPGEYLRRTAQFVYAGILLFQFGNLSVHAYGPLAEAKVPLYLDKPFQKVYDDHGMYLFKPVLHGSFSYGRMQAPTKENHKDRLFFAMLQSEQERPFHGIEATYARLNIRGMALDEQHFWPDESRPNPFLRNDIPPELMPYRYLRQFGWSLEIEPILSVLNTVDYVAYTTEDITPQKEQEWLQALDNRGFQLLERFEEPRFGMVPARHFGLLVRRAVESLPEIKSDEDIQNLNFFDLYKIRHSAVFKRLTPEFQNTLVERMHAQPYLLGTPVSLDDGSEFFGGWVEHDQDDIFLFTLLLFNRKPRTEEYQFMIEARIAPEVMARHFGDQSGNFFDLQLLSSPVIPLPTVWPENDFVLVKFYSAMFPIPCHIRCTFFLPEEGPLGTAAELGFFDFEALSNQSRD